MLEPVQAQDTKTTIDVIYTRIVCQIGELPYRLVMDGGMYNEEVAAFFKDLGKILSSFEIILIAENNLGQLSIKIRSEFCSYTHSFNEVCANSNVIFVCVPTPMFESGECDLSIVEAVTEELSQYDCINKKVVVIKSTVVPGTTENLAEKYPEINFVFKTTLDNFI